MEVLGQGFALPLEDLAIAHNASQVYTQWLFERENRPMAFRQAEGTLDEQQLYQTIFHHYSLLFEALSNSSASSSTHATPTPQVPVGVLIQRHIEECNKVLTSFTMAGRLLGPSFSEETWEVLLKVLLGITDSLLREQPRSLTLNTEHSKMSESLCEHLLRVLFELWLRSNTRNVDMWNILQQCFNGWTHRLPVLQQWAASSLGLCQRVVRLLYGPGQGSEVVNLSVGGYNVGLELPADFTLYAWHRVVYLLNGPSRLSPLNCLAAVNGIGATSASGKPTSPDGNTIMHMFGAWLFENANSYPVDGYNDAQASAFGVLCRIFSKPQPSSRPFLRIYTERFYEALSIGLRCETSLPTILTHSAELFTSELEGVRMMVPDFVIGIRMAMSGHIRFAANLEKQKMALEDLHLAALKVAGCIMSLPNHFDQVELKEGWNQGLSKSASIALDGRGGREGEEVLAHLIRVLYTTDPSAAGIVPATKRFTSLKYYILEMLLSCLETETSSFNLRYLLHLIEVYVYEDVGFCPGLVGVVVKTIQEKMMTTQVPMDVALCAFDVLIGCAGLYEYVRRDSKNCARELVLALCKYVDELLLNHVHLTSTNPLVVRAYECMLRWTLAGQWIVGDQDCHLAVISCISNGIHIVERVEEHEASLAAPKPQPEKQRRWGAATTGSTVVSTAKHSSGSGNRSANSSISGYVKVPRPELLAIQHAAEIAMIRFSNQLGNFPIWTDDIGPRFEPLLAHQHYAYSAQSPVLNITGPVRYFMLDRRTIDAKKGFVDEHGPFAIVTMRDSNGKNSWKLRMNNRRDKTSVNVTRRNSLSSTNTASRDTLRSKSRADSEDAELSSAPSPTVLTEVMLNRRRLLNQVRWRMNAHRSLMPQWLGKNSVSNVFRILMAQMGYLSLENRSRIHPLRLSERLLAELEYLDDHLKDFEELIHGSPTGVSKDFTRFLDCLGWPIQVKSHTGYLGGLKSENCETTPYFADRHCEVIFHVPYLMRSSSPDLPPMQDHELASQFRGAALRDHVAILWIEERERMLNLLPLLDQNVLVYILIHPLGGDTAGGLFWIRIMVQNPHNNGGFARLVSNPLMIGPLADGMLVSRHALGSLIRNTAISADRACRQVTDSYMEPNATRARHIQDLLQTHLSEEPETISEFYRTMFAT
ncbi:MAG: hypothetical protein J3Q66DRAFT_286574 [Benniella sp.]|nr:MAG: hypothetical protein J3Q66DRAFT_286574 [Benniella sp.]